MAPAGRRTMPARGTCSKKLPRKITPAHWSGWARSPRRDAADRRMPAPPRPITKGPQHSAMKTPRRRSSAWSALTRSRTSAEISSPIFVSRALSSEVETGSLDPGPARFAAHVAYYPAGVFGAIAEAGAYTGSPVLMLLGEKDDNLPVAKVESYLAYARAAGNPTPIEVVTYPGAYHAWTVPSLVTLRFYPEYVSTKKCPLILLGPNRPVFLIDGQAKPFDPSSVGACIGEAPGYSMAYDAAVRAQSTADAMRFLQRNFQP